MKAIHKYIITSALVVSGITSANAGVVIGGTRVIYDGGKREASLSVSNPDSVAYLIQSWIDSPNGGADKAPFVITPPLYRLDQGQQNVMRIVRAGNLPDNKESMYWLNVKSIPSSERRENTLQIAVKTRIKLIYRPQSLKDHVPEDVADKLSWEKVGSSLKVINPTSYYMNFNEISVGGKIVPDVTYVAPGQTATFALPASITGGKITYKLISDFGGTGKPHAGSL